MLVWYPSAEWRSWLVSTDPQEASSGVLLEVQVVAAVILDHGLRLELSILRKSVRVRGTCPRNCPVRWPVSAPRSSLPVYLLPHYPTLNYSLPHTSCVPSNSPNYFSFLAYQFHALYSSYQAHSFSQSSTLLHYSPPTLSLKHSWYSIITYTVFT